MRANRQWLIGALEADESLVRLELRGPGDRGDLGPGPGPGETPGGRFDGRRPPPPNGDRPPPRNGDFTSPDQGPEPWFNGMMERDDAIMGDFAAVLKLPNGQWRIVQPAGGGLRGWYLRMFYWLIAALGVVVPLAWWLAPLRCSPALPNSWAVILAPLP